MIASFNPSLISAQANPYQFLSQYSDIAAIQKGAPAIPGYSHTWYFFGFEESKKLLQSEFIEPNFRKDFQINDSEHEYLSPERLALWQHVANWPLFESPPLHTSRRALLAQSFRQATMLALASYIQAESDRLISQAMLKRYVNLQQEFIAPLAVSVISKVIGIPSPDSTWLKVNTYKISRAFDFGSTSQHYIEGLESLNLLVAFIKEMLIWKKQHLSEDLLSSLICKMDNVEPIDESVVISMMTQVLIAGQETISGLMGNGIYAFTKHAEQLTLLKENPSLIDNAVAEILRYDSSLLFTSTRVLKDNFTYGDIQIRAGETTSVVLAACNHDSRRYSNPSQFDIQRDLSGTELSFGHGIHYCIGSHLARLVTKIALQTLIKKLPNHWVLEEPVIWRSNNNMRGPTSLFVATNN